jgi:hypothetical protein
MEERQAEMDKLVKVQELAEKMDKYYATIKAGSNKSTVLGTAKSSLDNTEYKLLLLMLQMRGTFGKDGVPMLNNYSQTEPVEERPYKIIIQKEQASESVILNTEASAI